MPADDVVVHVVARVAAASRIEDLTDADIESLYDNEVTAALGALRQGRAKGATRFVFVLPWIAERGASEHAATCAAAESVRVLAVSAARQWVADSVTVNCVTMPWPYDGALKREIAPVVSFLVSAAGENVSGQTIRIGGPPVGV